MKKLDLAQLVGVALLSAGARGEIPEAPRPGGIAVVPLGESDAAPAVTYRDMPVMVLRDNGAWLAVVGIPLDQEVGRSSVTVVGGDGTSSTREFEVRAHQYREQRLSVERKYVDLSEQQLERVGAERRIIDAALTNWRDQAPASLSLGAPVAGRRSSSFGLRRFFNDQPRSPHKGMDIAAISGTPIMAPAAGVVTATGDFYFNGNTVILDHGSGFVTLYCHLANIDVVDGQAIGPGEPLGEVGATGRVTGAHLHFATYLNGTAVDPALFLPPADP